MKKIAIIPVAGAGTRFRPFTYSQPKALIPVAGKPIISYIVDELINNNIKDFIFIVGYLGDKIIDYIRANYKTINCQFVYQNHREGLGHAIYLTEKIIDKNAELIIMLGDCMVDIPISFIDSKVSTIALKKVDNPCNFGIVEVDKNNFITKFIEKPNVPFSNLAMVGLYKIIELEIFFAYLKKLNKDNIRTNGEIQLTDALQMMVSSNIVFKSFLLENWLDVGQGDVLLEANSILLKKNGSYISKTAQIINSVIIEPVYIAEDSLIENSIIGPNVTIGNNSKIINSILNSGIIGNFSFLKKIQLSDFVIGSDSSLKGTVKSLTVGDNTDIDFGFDN